jgi:hypothetical protein
VGGKRTALSANRPTKRTAGGDASLPFYRPPPHYFMVRGTMGPIILIGLLIGGIGGGRGVKGVGGRY